AARFKTPQKVWSDGVNLYIADANNAVIRKVVIATGVTTTVAGLPGVPGTADGVGTAARFVYPSGIWGDSANLFVADTLNHTIRRIKLATGAVTTVAGTPGIPGLANGNATAASFNSPSALCGDGINLYVADTGNHMIRQVDLTSGAVTLLA